ncbi:MAG: hypothetical protein AAFO96_29130, partial [Bacteroidota bacterium]
MSSKEESIRVITFDGKKVAWSSWKEKFLARAQKKGYKGVLLGEIEVLKESIVVSDDDVDRISKLKSRELNESAYADLILSIDCEKSTGRSVFNLIKGSKSEDYPNGHAGKAWESLVRKFNPRTANTMTKLHRMFYNTTLNKGSDPVGFMTYMEDLRYQLKDAGEEMSDRQFVTQTMNSLTDIYDNEVRMIEREIDMGQSVDIEELKDRLALVHERSQSRSQSRNYKDDNEPEGESRAFAAFGGFKGRCNACGKQGHKAAQCPEKNDQSSNNGGNGGSSQRFNGKCNWCGIPGHRENQCFKKKNGKPKTYFPNGNNENNGGSFGQANSAVDESVAFLHCQEFCVPISNPNGSLSDSKYDLDDSFFDNFYEVEQEDDDEIYDGINDECN